MAVYNISHQTFYYMFHQTEGILCQEVRRYESPEGFHLNLEFVDLPPVTEKELVRLVNQGQITISPPAEEGNTS